MYMTKLVGFLCLSLLTLSSAGALAADAILDPLVDQRDLVETLSPTVDRVDLARLTVLKTSIEAVIRDVQGNRSAKRKDITFQTLRFMQNLIIQYRFSQVFLGWTEPKSITSIYTEDMADTLSKL